MYIFPDLWNLVCFSGDSLPKVQCPNHPDAQLVEDYRAGDMICPECGLVVGTSFHLNIRALSGCVSITDLNNKTISVHFLSFAGDRVIDVGSEWRTFTNEKATKDPSRVGDAQNPLLNGGDLTTMISKVRNLSTY